MKITDADYYPLPWQKDSASGDVQQIERIANRLAKLEAAARLAEIAETERNAALAQHQAQRGRP